MSTAPSFQCDLCPKKYVRAAGLKNHRRSHTGERPFECEQCNDKFRTRDSYRLHQATHRTHSDYQCHACNRSFTRLESLKRHTRSETHRAAKFFNQNSEIRNVPHSEASPGPTLRHSSSHDSDLGPTISVVESPPARGEGSTNGRSALIALPPADPSNARTVIAADAGAWFDAARSGDVEGLIRINAIGNIGIDQREGNSREHSNALDMVSEKGHHDALTALIRLGANVNPIDAHSLTPLQWAVWGSNKDCFLSLIEQGANSSVYDFFGYSLLMLGASKECDIDIYNILLLEAGNINHKGREGQSIVHVAARRSNSLYLSLALDKGADVTARNNGGSTGLHAAASEMQQECIRVLLAKQISLVFTRDGNGRTALHALCGWSIDKDSEEDASTCVQLLLNAGAEIDAVDMEGFTPLMSLLNHLLYSKSSYLLPSIARALLKGGADVNVVGMRDKTALDIALNSSSLALGMIRGNMLARALGMIRIADIEERNTGVANLKALAEIIALLVEKRAQTAKQILAEDSSESSSVTSEDSWELTRYLQYKT